MRVLLLSKAMIVGTYQRKAEEIAAQPGVELTVAVPPHWDEPGVGRTLLEPRHLNGYQLMVLPMWLNGHFHTHFYPGLKRLLDHVRPDVFHIDEEAFNLATFQAMRLGVAAGAKCCFYNWANIRRTYPPPFWFFEQYVFNHADAGIAGNHEAAEIIRAHGYRGPVHIVPQFGVDPDLFHPVSTPLAAQPFRIGYFGRLQPQKGVRDLVHALALLPASVELTIIGSGDQAALLRTEIERLGLTSRVDLRPLVPSGEVAAEMRKLHAFVLPSHTTPTWKEQFGRVLIEAMASGVPPIGSDSGEIPHVIGDAGLIFHEGDVTDLAAKIRQLIEQPALRAQLAQRGRQRVLDHYTQRAIARHYVEIYRAMLVGNQTYLPRK